jgi:hypothetical protein
MKPRILKLVCIAPILLMISVSTCAQSRRGSPSGSAIRPASSDAISAVKRSGPIFVFHTDEFWLNLHHFLYVLGRAENKERDATREAVAGAPADQERGFEKLTTTERGVWREGVASYAAGTSKKDLVFDDPLPTVTNALARAGDSRSLTGSEVDPAVAGILQRAAPIYRKAWWKKHHDANRKWHKVIQSLVDRACRMR